MNYYRTQSKNEYLIICTQQIHDNTREFISYEFQYISIASKRALPVFYKNDITIKNSLVHQVKLDYIYWFIFHKGTTGSLEHTMMYEINIYLINGVISHRLWGNFIGRPNILSITRRRISISLVNSRYNRLMAMSLEIPQPLPGQTPGRPWGWLRVQVRYIKENVNLKVLTCYTKFHEMHAVWKYAHF